MDAKKYAEFSAPPVGEIISHFDHCHCFSARTSLLAKEPICWFCRFADFDLLADKLPENGVCKYPVAQAEHKQK